MNIKKRTEKYGIEKTIAFALSKLRLKRDVRIKNNSIVVNSANNKTGDLGIKSWGLIDFLKSQQYTYSTKEFK